MSAMQTKFSDWNTLISLGLILQSYASIFFATDFTYFYRIFVCVNLLCQCGYARAWNSCLIVFLRILEIKSYYYLL